MAFSEVPRIVMETFQCPVCRARTQLVRDGAHKYVEEYSPTELYVLGHCVACHHPGLLRLTEIGPNEWASDQLFPKSVATPDFALPDRVKESYFEALMCHDAKAHLATAVMIRRTLEAIAKEFDPSAKNLFSGLKAMMTNGLISNELYQWGDELRFIGNIGAHPTDDVVSEADTQDALEFLNAIVETIYHLRPRFQAMRARRERGGSQGGGQS